MSEREKLAELLSAIDPRVSGWCEKAADFLLSRGVTVDTGEAPRTPLVVIRNGVRQDLPGEAPSERPRTEREVHLCKAVEAVESALRLGAGPLSLQGPVSGEEFHLPQEAKTTPRVGGPPSPPESEPVIEPCPRCRSRNYTWSAFKLPEPFCGDCPVPLPPFPPLPRASSLPGETQ